MSAPSPRFAGLCLAAVVLAAAACNGAAPIAPATPASQTPAATTTIDATATIAATTAVAATASPTSTVAVASPPPSTTAATSLGLPTPFPSAVALADPRCDPYLTGAEVASVAGTVTRVQGSERPGIENQKATDLLCVYTLSTGASVRFQVAHELVNGTKAGGGEMDPAEIDKIKQAGGKPVAGLGRLAFGLQLNGTGIVVWQVAKNGVNTTEDELDGVALADLLKIAKLVRTPR